MTKAAVAKKDTTKVAPQEQESQSSFAGLGGVFRRVVDIAKPVVKASIPALKKAGPILVGGGLAAAPAAAAVVGTILVVAAIGVELEKLGERQQAAKSKAANTKKSKAATL